MGQEELGSCGYQGGAAAVIRLWPSKFVQMHVYDNNGQVAFVDEDGAKKIYMMLQEVALKLGWEKDGTNPK